jgi:hypothetical protein
VTKKLGQGLNICFLVPSWPEEATVLTVSRAKLCNGLFVMGIPHKSATLVAPQARNQERHVKSQTRFAAHKPPCSAFCNLLILRVPSCRKSAPHNQMFLVRESPADRLQIACELTTTLA